MNAPAVNDFKQWFQQREEEIRKDFFTFLSFPSISTDPAFSKEVHNTADWLADQMRRFGIRVEKWEAEEGYPVLYGESLKGGAEAPTVLFYAHYDVQPVDPLELWITPPFTPTQRGKEIYARGAIDDKGQCFYTVQGVRAFLELAKQKKINIKFFIEGEEESGIKATYEVIKKHGHRLKADHLLIVDSGMISPGHPAVTLGTRGLVTMQVECTAASTDLHSGSHGGIILNPNRALAAMLSQLWDAEGKVTIPGFYDAVKTLSPEEKNQLHMPFDPREYEEMFGATALAPEPGFDPGESNLLRPTIEINGIAGGYTGLGFKTVIPAKATAKLSSRLVPDQDPQVIAEAISSFLHKICPKGIALKIDLYSGEKAFRTSPNTQIVKTAAKAYEEIFGVPCAFTLTGGSIPIAPTLAAASGAETALIGTGLEDDAFHAPNEHFGWDRFEAGFLSIGRILTLLC